MTINATVGPGVADVPEGTAEASVAVAARARAWVDYAPRRLAAAAADLAVTVRRIHAAGVPAARQAAFLFLVGGALAFWRDALPAAPGSALTVVGLLAAAAAGLAWGLPWGRWDRYAPLLLVPVGLALLASAAAAGGFGGGTAPFLVLVSAWVGLHFPPAVVVAAAPAEAVAELALPAWAGRSPTVLLGTLVAVPVATAVGVVIAQRVRQLERAREQIRSAERWRASLMTTLAHDVRSPLSTVQAALELLATDDGGLAAVDRQALSGAARRQTDRVLRLATSLLDVERVRAGALRLDLADVAVREAALEAAALVGGAGVRVVVDPALRLRADPQRLEQVLVNLLTNALRHGAPPVIVAARRLPGGVQLTVRDHGAGMPAVVRRRLGVPVRVSAHGSAGLGLWIVGQLVEAHGGTVGYQAATPGVRVVVTLPTG